MRWLSIILISLLTFMAQPVSASSEGEVDVAEMEQLKGLFCADIYLGINEFHNYAISSAIFIMSVKVV